MLFDFLADFLTHFLQRLFQIFSKLQDHSCPPVLEDGPTHQVAKKIYLLALVISILPCVLTPWPVPQGQW